MQLVAFNADRGHAHGEAKPLGFVGVRCPHGCDKGVLFRTRRDPERWCALSAAALRCAAHACGAR